MEPIDIYEEIIKNYKLQQIEKEWIEFIGFLQATQPKTVIEIGSYSGGSAFTFSFFAETIITIDENDKFRNRSKIKENSKLFFINKNSHQGSAANRVKKILEAKNIKADLLFLDGDHTEVGAKKDFYLYKQFVKEGGYIVLHDILTSAHHTLQHCLVYNFWNELKKEYPNFKEIIYGNKWGGLGIIKL